MLSLTWSLRPAVPCSYPPPGPHRERKTKAESQGEPSLSERVRSLQPQAPKPPRVFPAPRPEGEAPDSRANGSLCRWEPLHAILLLPRPLLALLISAGTSSRAERAAPGTFLPLAPTLPLAPVPPGTPPSDIVCAAAPSRLSVGISLGGFQLHLVVAPQVGH